ncbi:serine/threonine-protein kinase [Virgisporangium ochraceum]|nr:serine/threonine-protein kinase [Virgisporangium ochraceum]
MTGLSVLARGGYATVYRAMQESVGRLVAVKVENGILENERDQRRFMREARAAGRMSSHPHVVDLFDAGVTNDGHPYLIMELCQGSYSERMRRQPLSPAEARDVGVKIADALADAHELGVLHRDVKPANILMTHFGEPALADFGLAILTENRDISITLDVLTPAYAPPEMFRHAPPAPPADVYALCATLYALMAGRPPRWPQNSADPSLESLVDMFSDPVADLPHVPRDLMALVMRGMSTVEPARPRAAELRDELLAMELGAVPLPTGMLRHQPASGPTGHGAPAHGSPTHGSSAEDADSGETQVVNPEGPLAPAAPPTPTVYPPPTPTVYPPPAGARVMPGPPAMHGLYQPPGPQFPPPNTGGARQPTGVRPGPWPGADAAPAGASGRRLLLAGIAAGYVVALAALVIGAFYLRSAEPTTTFVSEPVQSTPACPLAPAGAAQCVREPECFDRVTVQSGVARAPAVACVEPHVWEVFATASLPQGLDTASHSAIKQNAEVRQVCSTANAKAINPQQNWQIEVLPPSRDQVRAGDRTYRCLAGNPPTKLRDSRFAR